MEHWPGEVVAPAATKQGAGIARPSGLSLRGKAVEAGLHRFTGGSKRGHGSQRCLTCTEHAAV